MLIKVSLFQRIRAAGLGLVVTGFFALGASLSANAAPVDIASSPLYLSTSVKPNVILAIDDSGSMDSEVLMPGNDGAAWWHTGDKSFVGRDRNDNAASGVINFNSVGTAGSTWKKYVYLFPNGSGTGNRIYTDSSNDHYAIPPLPQFAFFRSSAYNKMYFDPAVSYKPWVDYGSTTFANANPTNAPSDPVRGGNSLNLTANIDSATANWTFKLHDGMRVPTGTIYNGTTRTSDLNITSTTDGRISYYPATFYLPQGAALPQGFGFKTSAKTTSGRGPAGEVLDGYEIKSANFDSTETYNAAIQNFANWYSYYRKRHIATRGGIGRAFENIAKMRVASFTINNRVDVSMLDLAVASERNSFYSTVYSSVGSGGTPNREALKHIGDQFKRTGAGAPITHACQQNFGILFTDGYSNVWTGAGVGNADGTQGSPYQDSVSNTMADIAMSYYLNNLRPDLQTGQVVPPAICTRKGATPGPEVNCNTNLHMATYAITLGGQGNIFGVNAAATADPYKFPPTWPTTFPDRHPSAVDDLWHATINGRGALLNAGSASDLDEKFTAVLGNIASATSSSSAAAANSTSYRADTKIYQASFDTDRWSGEVKALNIDADGKTTGEAWKATGKFPADISDRNIITYNPSSKAWVLFDWSSLDDSQKAALNTNSSGVNDGRGSDRLLYLRGNRSGEGSTSSTFRQRSSILGDIVNSDPFYVGTTENYGYSLLSVEGSSYSGFLSTKKARDPMLYVGANDGMLHAFHAESGEEKFAFVPNAVFPNLSKLTAQNYSHQYYVDGPPTVGDAYVNGKWRSILVGTLGAGGRSIFALDVTAPKTFSASNVLWEITDPDLGYVLGPPAIARLDGGDWVAIFGNGYNSSSETAKLFVVNLATKAVTVIDTKSGPSNGLGPAVPVDLDGDLDADVAYAGDLQGNLWKFDLTGNSNTWKVAYKQSGNPTPLFVARDRDGKVQPITARPTVGQASTGDIIVLFGTGKFIGTGDRLVSSSTPIQSFYGIKDQGSPITTTTRSELQQQTIITETSTYRLTSQNPVAASKTGWYIDLIAASKQGEMVVNPALLVYGKAVFTTLIPPVDNPCTPGGNSWLMVLDAMAGVRPSGAVLDTNKDGKVDDTDNIKPTSGAGDVVTGAKQDGIVEVSSVIETTNDRVILMLGDDGQIMQGADPLSKSRQSWRQLR